MTTRRASRPLVRRSELAAAAAVLLAIVFSLFFWTTFGWPSPPRGARYLCLASGGIDYLHYPDALVPQRPHIGCSLAGSPALRLWFNRASPLGGFGLSIPLWPAFLIPFIPAAVRLARRALTPATRCRHCGYDLRGLDISLPCPECGEDRRALFAHELSTIRRTIET